MHRVTGFGCGRFHNRTHPRKMRDESVVRPGSSCPPRRQKAPPGSAVADRRTRETLAGGSGRATPPSESFVTEGTRMQSIGYARVPPATCQDVPELMRRIENADESLEPPRRTRDRQIAAGARRIDRAGLRARTTDQSRIEPALTSDTIATAAFSTSQELSTRKSWL